MNGRGLVEPSERACRNVLELKGHDIHRRRELVEGRAILVGRNDVPAHLGGRRVGGRVQKAEALAQTRAGEGKHPSELAPAKNADHTESRRGSGCDRTASVWRDIHVSTVARIESSASPSMRAASNAALTAPALPIASVPTGTPPGICAIDSSESIPFRAADSTGTPRTGSAVLAAA